MDTIYDDAGECPGSVKLLSIIVLLQITAATINQAWATVK
jgi:hypothetical protein